MSESDGRNGRLIRIEFIRDRYYDEFIELSLIYELLPEPPVQREMAAHLHTRELTVEQFEALGVSEAGVDAVRQARRMLNPTPAPAPAVPPAPENGGVVDLVGVVEGAGNDRIWGVEESIGVVDGGVVDLVAERGGHGTGVGAGVGAGVVVSNDPLRRQIGDLRRDRPNRFSPY